MESLFSAEQELLLDLADAWERMATVAQSAMERVVLNACASDLREEVCKPKAAL